MIEQLLNDPAFKLARQNRMPYCWGARADIVCPEWSTILENLSRSWGITGGIKEMKGMGYVDYLGHRIPVVGEIRKEIQSLSAEYECTAHNYISFSQFSEHYPRHRDDSEIWIWQLQGTSKWKVECPDGTVFEHTMEPGHWLYVPSMLWHLVKPLGARSAISFALEECKPIVYDEQGKQINRWSRGVPTQIRMDNA
jgi:hypothetical protein